MMSVGVRKKPRKKIKRWSVYVHIHKINGKGYVGITDQKPQKRWGKNGEGYKGCPKFYEAIKTYGWSSFYHIILLENLTEKQAREKEKYFINKFNTLYKNGNGWNMRVG